MFNAAFTNAAAGGIPTPADIDYKPDFTKLPFMPWLLGIVNGVGGAAMIVLMGALIVAALVIAWGHMSHRGGMEKAGVAVVVLIVAMMIIVGNAGRIADWASGQNIMGAMTPLALSLAA